MWFYVFVALILLYVYLTYRPIYPRGLKCHAGVETPHVSPITTHILTCHAVPNNPDPTHATSTLTSIKSLQFVKTGYGLVHVALIAPEGGKDNIELNEINEICGSLVVLIHGFSIPMIIWSSLAAALRRDGRYVLLMDNYGRGFSDSPDVTHDGGLYVAQVNQVLTALKITRPIHLAGVSMGGAIAALYTSCFPSHVASLTLFCPAGMPTSARLHSIVHIPLLAPLLFKIIALEKVLKNDSTWTVKNTPLYHAYARFFTNKVASHSGYLRALFATLTEFPMYGLAPVYDSLGREFTRPTCIIWGTHDTLLPYHSMGLELKKLIPHATLIPIDGANHSMLIDTPQECIQAYSTFLKQQQ